MDYIEQDIDVLIKNKIDYKKIDNINDKREQLEIRNIDEFFERIKNISGISIIIGYNGIGKTYLLEMLRKKFNLCNIKVDLIKFRDYANLASIKQAVESAQKYIIFDGVDEINSNILSDILQYVLSIKDKNVIISSRKDFAQKRNLIDIKYNVYELKPLESYKIDSVLENNGLNKQCYKNIYNLLKIPRFLTHLISVKENVKDTESINKFDLMEMMLKRHFGKLNERAAIKLEANIHKKILQSLALIMMMIGKSNLSMEEFTIFLSNINHLDIKSYILNKDIIESFLNNQILLNYNDLIAYENKEIMEFLAAKEIYENNFSNKDLFNIVTVEKNGEINTLWFNTISYLMSKSEVYYNLILEYIFNNMKNNDNLLDLLLIIDYKSDNKDIIMKNIETFIFQYTKLYQYMPFGDGADNVLKILTVDIKQSFKNLTNIFIKSNSKTTLEKFDIIFINNTLSCLYYLVENYSFSKIETKKLRNYLVKHKIDFLQSDNFKVRYLHICLKLFEKEEIDNLFEIEIDKRLLSIFLYDRNDWNKFDKIENHLNNYILNYKNRYDNNIFIDDDLIAEFICKNYNTYKLKKLINNIKNENNITSFFRFLNSSKYQNLWVKLSKKSVTTSMYNKIIYKLMNEKSEHYNLIREEMIFEHRNLDALEKILELCLKYECITLDTLNSMNTTSNYTLRYLQEVIIKIILNNTENITMIYKMLNDKKIIFNVWKLDLDSEQRTKLESQIKKYFYNDYLEYKKVIAKFKNKEYVKVETTLEKFSSKKDIYYKIENIYNLINDEKKYFIINSNIILKNTLKSITKEIEKYVSKIDVASKTNDVANKIYIKRVTGSYRIDCDLYYYEQAIFILSKMKYDINEYNDTNIIFLNKNDDMYNLKYTDDNYKKLLSYITKKDSRPYVKYFLREIIEKLKKYNLNDLIQTLFKFIDCIKFNEYEINYILSFIINNIELLDEEEIKKLKKFRKYKICQDILIELGYKDEIKNRIDYIKKNLVFEGDLISAEEKSNFEYSSGSYTNSLCKMGYENKNYILELLSFMFEIYNTGDYYAFSSYILDMVIKYINNNIEFNINDIIDFIIISERNNKNRYLYKICSSIASLKKIENSNILQTINNYNAIISNQNQKIYSYWDLYLAVKEILENNIFDDLKKMKFLEIFRDKDTKKIKPLREETYQFLIGYELNRILNFKGFSTKVIFEPMGIDKKRSDIQLVTEGFIQNIVIETKLSSNSDISNEDSIKSYINNTLQKYSNRFNSPKILFVIINQNYEIKTANKKIDLINKSNTNLIDVILIDLKDSFS